MLKLSALGDRHRVYSPVERNALMEDAKYYARPVAERELEKGNFSKIPFRSVKSYIKRNNILGLKFRK